MEQNIEKQFQKGVSAHKRGNLQEAGHFYQNVLQSYPLHQMQTTTWVNSSFNE